MSLVKTGKIASCCQPNAMMTLMEYLEDYASAKTREKGLAVIRKELEAMPDGKLRLLVAGHLEKILSGVRDFRL